MAQEVAEAKEDMRGMMKMDKDILKMVRKVQWELVVVKAEIPQCL